MATKSSITSEGKITFTNSNSEALPVSLGSNTLILTVYGDNVNVWYDSGNVRTSETFTGEVHYRIV